MLPLLPLLTLLAHEMPPEVTAHLRLLPQGQTLAIAARVPLAAMRDVDFPEDPQGYLLVSQLSPQLPTIATTWLAHSLRLQANGQPLPVPTVTHTRLALLSDRSFPTFSPSTPTTLTDSDHLIWRQLWLDVWLTVPLPSPNPRLSLRPGLEHLGARVTTHLEYQQHFLRFEGDPGFLDLSPTFLSTSLRFTRSGAEHILSGLDHLLFLFCLILPLRQPLPLLKAVTGFTLGHSLTLVATALNLLPSPLWFSPFIETTIAASILWLALTNIAGFTPRWLPVACFGLVHGCGFAAGLQDSLQFAGPHLPAALFAFNLGVELGQLLILAPLFLLFRHFPPTRIWLVILSVLAAHAGWHWLLDRAAILSRFWVSQ